MKRLLIFSYILCYNIMGIAQGEDVRLMHFSEADGYNQAIVNFAMQDSQGYVWLGTWDGICRYDGYRFRNYKMRPGDGSPLRTNRIGTIQERTDGNLECTTTDSLFFIFYKQTGQFQQTNGEYRKRPRPYKADNAVIEQVKRLPTFANVFIRILLVDRQGGIWIDTHSGLYRVWFTKKALSPTKFSDKDEEAVRGLYIDRQGHTWVADKNGYVRLFAEDRSLLGFLSPEGSLSKTPVTWGQSVYCFYQDKRGNIWMGSKPSGLTRLTPQGAGAYTVKHYTHDEQDDYSLNCNNIYAITEDARGRLWIATYGGGLNMLDLNSKRDLFLHSGNGLTGWPRNMPASKVYCLYITPTQTLIAGTQGGLITCALTDNPQQIRFFQNRRRPHDASSLPYDWVSDIQPVQHDTIVVATFGGGLGFVNSQQLLSDSIIFQSYTTSDGLPSDICQSMFYDPHKGLYVVSPTAISHLSLHDHTLANYLRGTLSEHFNFLEEKPVHTKDGHFLFGTTQGVLDISPNDIKKSNYLPNIVFDEPDTLSLSPNERNLSIHFAALDFNKRVPITYAYFIDGMTSQWTYITDNTITLHDIPAGTFLLHLRSTNGDGVWMPNERMLTIYRRAAFHETPYAWMLYGLMLTLLVIGILQTVRYVRRIQREIKDIRLTSQQRISVMSERIQELLNIRETVERVDAVEEDIENEEERIFAEHIKTYVLDNIGNAHLSVTEMAREMAVSRTVLFARMKSVFGTSPVNYLLNQRIKQAQQLLHQPNLYVAEVAYRCGFSDPKYFSKCFKKIVGMTPTEYQKKQ